MESSVVPSFLLPKFKYEDNVSTFQEYIGDHLTVQLDPNIKSETQDSSENDISLSNTTDDDCVNKFKDLVDNNIRHGDILQEHLQNLSSFLVTLSKKIENVESDRTQINKINKELQKCLQVAQSQINKLENSVREKVLVINNRDEKIKMLENEIHIMKDSIESGFTGYEYKISDLLKELENEKLAKLKFNNSESQEFQNKLASKDKQILKLICENSNVKRENGELLNKIHLLLNKSKSRDSVLVEELNQKINIIAAENINLNKKNTFLNQSIKDLLCQVRDLQEQVKLIKPNQFLKYLNAAHRVPSSKDIIINKQPIADSIIKDMEIMSIAPEQMEISRSSSLHRSIQQPIQITDSIKNKIFGNKKDYFLNEVFQK